MSSSQFLTTGLTPEVCKSGLCMRPCDSYTAHLSPPLPCALSVEGAVRRLLKLRASQWDSLSLEIGFLHRLCLSKVDLYFYPSPSV